MTLFEGNCLFMDYLSAALKFSISGFEQSSKFLSTGGTEKWRWLHKKEDSRSRLIGSAGLIGVVFAVIIAVVTRLSFLRCRNAADSLWNADNNLRLH